MEAIKSTLESLSNYRTALIEHNQTYLDSLSSLKAKDSALNAVIAGTSASTSESMGNSYMKVLKNIHEGLSSRLRDVIRHCAKIAAEDPDFRADVAPFIEEHAPLWTPTSPSSTLLSIVDRSWSISSGDFTKGLEMVASFDFEALYTPIVTTFTPNAVFDKRCAESARTLVRSLGLNYNRLNEVVKRRKQAFVLSRSIYSRANTIIRGNEKSRELPDKVEELFRIEKALTVAARWSGNDAFYDLQSVFNQLRGDSNYYVYFDSRDKFTSGGVRMTLFKEKMELAMPPELFNVLVGFMRSFAAPEMRDTRDAA